jgi:hypothetical protein
MRFVPDGPEIPNPLISKWRDGKVLFLAGAGISVPSKLPLFDGLALSVYKALKDPMHETMKKANSTSGAKRRKILDDAALTPPKTVEAGLFFDRQFDRFFSVLEKRFDPDLKGRPKTRNVRDAVQRLLSGKKPSQSHADLLRLSFAPSDKLGRPVCRIVTTNFDLLFESAWKAECGTAVVSCDARIAPRPGAHNFEGVIHLHGALDVDPKRPTDFVLSSRDFARVYLRSGVIGNYIYDLIRRYTVVLIGYSADDPPMRYLMDAIGEDATLFDDMNRPYAITSLSHGSVQEVEEEIWRSKEIEASFFGLRPGSQPYGPLWDSINEWANWARGGTRWVHSTLTKAMSAKYADATPFQIALVQDIFAVLTDDERNKAAEHLNRIRVDFGWIAAVSAGIDPSSIRPTATAHT